MSFMERSIYNFENKYKNRMTKARLILLLNKYYLGFLTMNKKFYLNKAYSTCIEYLNKNSTDFDIIFALLFFSIKIGNKERIDYFLRIISKHKKYIKNNDEKLYLFYLYLKGLIKSIEGSSRGVNKYIKIIQSFKDKLEIIEINFYITSLKLENNSLDRDSIDYMSNQYNNSLWGNILLYNVFEKSSKFINLDKKLFKKYIKWAVHNELDIYKSILMYKDSILFEYKEYDFNKKFYKKYNYDFILYRICDVYLNKNKFNDKSYFFYKEAINRQLNLNGLNYGYIMSCFKNNIEEIEFYNIKEFLRKKNKDFEVIAFIYHVIINNEKYRDLVVLYKDKIMQYGLYFLEKKLIGKYYYNIYRYMLDFVPENSDEEKKIMEILYDNIFTYEIDIDNKNIKYIIIKDQEINELKFYEIENEKTIIKAISSNFYYYVFSSEKKEVLNINLKVKKIINNINPNIILRFYKRGFSNKFILINVAKYYLTKKEIDKNNIEVLEYLIKDKDISFNFKMKVLQIIGNTYFYNKDYKKAILYYSKVPEDQLNNKFVKNILLSYLKNMDYERSIEIIRNKINVIEQDILFYSLKSICNIKKEINNNDIYETDKIILKKEVKNYNKNIVHFMYELILKYNIDSDFIDIIIENYNGGLEKWIKLRKLLKDKGIKRKQIDERILELTIYTHNLNSNSEEIFIEIYKEDINNPIIEQFLNYCMYESFYSDYKFKNDFISIMEHLFKETNSKIIGYSLAHIYLKGNYIISEKENIFQTIIKNMEKDNINFKIFENNKEKFKNSSYLYKNKPFIYNSALDKEVYLFYREVNEENFNSIKMRYFKFGIYIATLPIFYRENIEYYFMENTITGSISTRKEFITNNENRVFNIDDEYFKINNAIIHSYDGRYDLAHNLIKEVILKDYNLKGKIL